MRLFFAEPKDGGPVMIMVTFDTLLGPIWCLLVLGDLVFTGSADKTIKVWDIENQFR